MYNHKYASIVTKYKIKYEKNLLNTKFAQDAKLDLTNMLEDSTEETSARIQYYSYFRHRIVVFQSVS